MRDKIKSEEYFSEKLKTLTTLFNRIKQEIERGNVKQERLSSVMQRMINMLLRKIQVKYSLSIPIKDLYEDYYNCIDLVSKHWSGNKKLMWTNKEVLNQYGLSDYDVMLWLLSIGYLLDVPNEKFMLLVD